MCPGIEARDNQSAFYVHAWFVGLRIDGLCSPASKQEHTRPHYIFTHGFLGLRADGLWSPPSKQETTRPLFILTHGFLAFALMVCVLPHRSMTTPVNCLSLHIGCWAFALMICIGWHRSNKISVHFYIYTWCLGRRFDGLRSHASNQENTRQLFIFTHGCWAFASMVSVFSPPIGLEKRKTAHIVFVPSLVALTVCVLMHRTKETPVHFLSLHMVVGPSLRWSVFSRHQSASIKKDPAHIIPFGLCSCLRFNGPVNSKGYCGRAPGSRSSVNWRGSGEAVSNSSGYSGRALGSRQSDIDGGPVRQGRTETDIAGDALGSRWIVN